MADTPGPEVTSSNRYTVISTGMGKTLAVSPTPNEDDEALDTLGILVRHKNWRWRGGFVGNKTYARGDVVQFSGDLWIAQRAVGSLAPYTDSPSWTLLARGLTPGFTTVVEAATSQVALKLSGAAMTTPTTLGSVKKVAGAVHVAMQGRPYAIDSIDDPPAIAEALSGFGGDATLKDALALIQAKPVPASSGKLKASSYEFSYVVEPGNSCGSYPEHVAVGHAFEGEEDPEPDAPATAKRPDYLDDLIDGHGRLDALEL